MWDLTLILVLCSTHLLLLLFVCLGAITSKYQGLFLMVLWGTCRMLLIKLKLASFKAIALPYVLSLWHLSHTLNNHHEVALFASEHNWNEHYMLWSTLNCHTHITKARIASSGSRDIWTLPECGTYLKKDSSGRREIVQEVVHLPCTHLTGV